MPLPWTPEDDYAARHCTTLASAAALTGRSIEAVRARRLRLGAPLSTLARGAPKKPAEARLSEDFRVFVTRSELAMIDRARVRPPSDAPDRPALTRSEWARSILANYLNPQ